MASYYRNGMAWNLRCLCRHGLDEYSQNLVLEYMLPSLKDLRREIRQAMWVAFLKGAGFEDSDSDSSEDQDARFQRLSGDPRTPPFWKLQLTNGSCSLDLCVHQNNLIYHFVRFLA